MKRSISFIAFFVLLIHYSFAQVFVPPGSPIPFAPASSIGINAIPGGPAMFEFQGTDALFENNNFRTGLSNIVPGGTSLSGALGFDNVLGSCQNSFALGTNNQMGNSTSSVQLGESNVMNNGQGSINIGGNNSSSGSDIITLGSNLSATGNDIVVIGNGVQNNTVNSLMVGFNSTAATLFVGPSAGLATTGKVGIGTSNPQEKLEVNGTIRSTALASGGRVCADAVGNLYVSGPCGSGGDDLGNHLATMDLDLACNNIFNSGSIGFCNGTGFNQTSPGELMVQGGPLGIGMMPSWMPGNQLTVAGNVWAAGVYVSSDKRYKKDINRLSSALNTVKQLNGYSYAYQQDAFPELNFPAGKTYGFIAQELEAIAPELVQQGANGYRAVNYSGMIPVLTEAIKEQQEIIETQATETAALRDELEELKAAVQSICNNGCGNLELPKNQQENLPTYWDELKLEQNAPNPFNATTTIRYYLPEQVQTAALLVYDLQGKQLKQFAITNTGAGSIEINAGELSGGMYLYGLLVDGKPSSTRKMILTE